MEVVTKTEGLTHDDEMNEEVFVVPEIEELEESKGEDYEEVKTSGVFVLRKPIEIDGTKTKKIKYDFEKIKPIEYINIVKRVQKQENAQVPELNMSVQFNVFCKAAGIPVAVLKDKVKMVNEFTAMCQLARDFLLSGQGETDEVL